MVDGFLLPNFGPEPDKKPIVSGHPEIEMALIELYRRRASEKMSIWRDTFCRAIRGRICGRSRLFT